MESVTCISGVAGFIGYSLAKKLLKEDVQVVGIDNFDETVYPSQDRRSRIVSLLNSHKNFMFINKDLLNLELSDLNREIKYFYHLAALPNQQTSWSNYDKYLRFNVLANYHLSKIVNLLSIEKVFYASTSSIYGSRRLASENDLASPENPYGISKLAGEHTFSSSIANSKERLVIGRLFSVYGPNQRSDMGIFQFIKSGMDGSFVNLHAGRVLRSLTYIDDSVSMMTKLLNSNVSGTFNICSSNTFTPLEILLSIENILKKKINYRFIKSPKGNQLEISGNNSKILSCIDFTNFTKIDIGLQNQIEWQKNLFK